MKKATVDFLLQVIGQLFRSVVVGLYAALGVMAAMGYDAALEEPGRVVFGACVAGGLRSLELFIPRPKDAA